MFTLVSPVYENGDWGDDNAWFWHGRCDSTNYDLDKDEPETLTGYEALQSLRRRTPQPGDWAQSDETTPVQSRTQRLSRH